MFFLYSLLYSFGLILAAPYYLWRMRTKGAGRGYWRERFGLLPPSFPSGEQGSIWVHAVSVGETLAVVPLVEMLQDAYHGRRIFLSHVTPAGREVGERRLPGLAGRFYLPFDWVRSVRRVLDQVRPALLVIVETELWPNLLHEAQAFGARVVIVNARLSERSLGGYSLVRPLMRRVVEPIDCVCAQTSADAERFCRLGARPERVVVTGNLKFDAQPPRAAGGAALRRALDRAGRTPVLVAASTMPGEEVLVLRAWEKVRERHPLALLLLAPRHPARFDEVARLLESSGKNHIRRTTLDPDESAVARQLGSAEVLLLDTVGELAGLFDLADVAFIGGSLVPTGGHNLLEPAYWAKPILFGPHMKNFRDVAQLFLEAGAAVEVRDPEELAERARELIENPERARAVGERAKQALAQASGASERVLGRIRELVEANAPARVGA